MSRVRKTKTSQKEETQQQQQQVNIETVVEDVKMVENMVDVVKKSMKEKNYDRMMCEINTLETMVSNDITKFNKVKKICKKLKSCVEKENNKKNKKKEPKRQRKECDAGFRQDAILPPSLKEAFGLQETEMKRPAFTKIFYEYLRQNNLKDSDMKKSMGSTEKGDGRIIRVNDVIQKAFKFTDDEKKWMNETTDPKDPKGLNFYTLQKRLALIYNECNKTEKEEPKNATTATVVVEVVEEKKEEEPKQAEKKVRKPKKTVEPTN